MLNERDVCTEKIDEIQKELPKGYNIRADTGNWTGAVKITRPNKTYFHALYVSDVHKYLHYGE